MAKFVTSCFVFSIVKNAIVWTLSGMFSGSLSSQEMQRSSTIPRILWLLGLVQRLRRIQLEWLQVPLPQCVLSCCMVRTALKDAYLLPWETLRNSAIHMTSV